MSRAKKESTMQLGDPFPLIPMTHFVKDQRFNLRDAWRLVGPTIYQNYRKHNQQDLYCIAFIEVMRMAVFSMRDDTPSAPEKAYAPEGLA